MNTRQTRNHGRIRTALILGAAFLMGSALLPSSALAAAAGWMRCATAGDICFTGGDVGIGTRNPNRVLHVQSEGELEVEIEETSPGSAAHLYMRNPTRSWLLYSDSNPDLFVIQDETQKLDRLAIDADGRVGIGTTSPDGGLHVEAPGNFDSPQLTLQQVGGPGADGFSRLRFRTISGGFWDLANGNDDSLRIFSSGGAQNIMTFQDSGGNVGIGTKTPNSTFEVADGYIELATSDGMPPRADCDAQDEVGRMKVDSTSTALYVCTARGWVRK